MPQTNPDPAFSPALRQLKIAGMVESILRGHPITRKDALFLLNLSGNDIYNLLYAANRLRLEHFGSQISLCAITSARTGKCPEDCRFCAQSAHYQTHVQPQTKDAQTIINEADMALQAGARCFGIVATGKAPTDTQLDQYQQVIKTIAAQDQLRCCGSLGCLTLPQAQLLYQWGMRQYNHNLETSERFFPQVVTTHTYADRLATVQAVKQSGMAACSGGIIGLGESLEDRVDLALKLRELNVDSVPLNFLYPIAGTPFAHNPPLAPLQALQTIAMFRFVLPDKHLKIAGGRHHCLRDLQSWMFFAGANSCMIGNYLTTPGRRPHDDLQMFSDLNLTW